MATNQQATCTNDFMAQTAALLTRHQKLDLIAPALAPLGIKLLLTEAYDTDLLGAFSGEISRDKTPVAAALTKAKLACELTGLRYGLGSEGSFGNGPLPGLLNWDDETLVWWDSQNDQVIVARSQGPVALTALTQYDAADVAAMLAQSESAQRWMLLPHQHDQKTANLSLFKGLSGSELSALWAELTALHGRSAYHAMPDLRAMYCPARQGYIRQAAEALARQLQQRCPKCQAPDFSVKATKAGLPCADCGLPTRAIQHQIYQCMLCGHQQADMVKEPVADPACCGFCNP